MPSFLGTGRGNWEHRLGLKFLVHLPPEIHHVLGTGYSKIGTSQGSWCLEGMAYKRSLYLYVSGPKCSVSSELAGRKRRADAGAMEPKVLIQRDQMASINGLGVGMQLSFPSLIDVVSHSQRALGNNLARREEQGLKQEMGCQEERAALAWQLFVPWRSIETLLLRNRYF